MIEDDSLSDNSDPLERQTGMRPVDRFLTPPSCRCPVSAHGLRAPDVSSRTRAHPRFLLAR